MKREKREINKILHYGKLRSQESQHGNQNGEKEDQAGILNVQQWQQQYWGRN
jgi:hypothetical protein